MVSLVSPCIDLCLYLLRCHVVDASIRSVKHLCRCWLNGGLNGGLNGDRQVPPCKSQGIKTMDVYLAHPKQFFYLDNEDTGDSRGDVVHIPTSGVSLLCEQHCWRMPTVRTTLLAHAYCANNTAGTCLLS